MNRRPFLAIALALPLASLSLPGSALAWDYSSGSSPRVQGSGKIIDDPRPLGAFSRIRMDDSLTVNARAGSKNSAVIRADDNIAPLILTSIEGDTLVVHLKPGAGFRTSTQIAVNIEFTQLRGAELRGSGDLNIDGLKGESLDLGLAGSGDVRLRGAELGKLSASLAGSGDVTLQGRAGDFQASIAGSGDIRAQDLIARSVQVSIAGSGDAKVHATESLSVQIAGSGDVSYGGNPPKVSSRVLGSGEIRASR